MGIVAAGTASFADRRVFYLGGFRHVHDLLVTVAAKLGAIFLDEVFMIRTMCGVAAGTALFQGFMFELRFESFGVVAFKTKVLSTDFEQWLLFGRMR